MRKVSLRCLNYLKNHLEYHLDHAVISLIVSRKLILHINQDQKEEKEAKRIGETSIILLETSFLHLSFAIMWRQRIQIQTIQSTKNTRQVHLMKLLSSSMLRLWALSLATETIDHSNLLILALIKKKLKSLNAFRSVQKAKEWVSLCNSKKVGPSSFTVKEQKSSWWTRSSQVKELLQSLLVRNLHQKG